MTCSGATPNSKRKRERTERPSSRSSSASNPARGIIRQSCAQSADHVISADSPGEKTRACRAAVRTGSLCPHLETAFPRTGMFT